MRWKNVTALGLAVVLGCSVLSGCGKKNTETVERQRIEENAKEEKIEAEETKEPVEEVPDDGKFRGKWVVDAEYAKGRVGAEDAVFVDSRGEKQAVLGTIDGAVATVWQNWSIQDGNARDEKWGCIPEPDALSGILGGLGITKDKETILLGETLEGWGDDSRLIMQMKR